MKRCRDAEVCRWSLEVERWRGAEVQRWRGGEVQRCRSLEVLSAEMQRCRGRGRGAEAEVQRCIGELVH